MNNQNYKLSELTTLIARGITPIYTDSTDSISVINQKCIRDGKINYDLCRKHNHQNKRIPSEKFLQINDILINSTGVGTLGRVSQIIDDISQTTPANKVKIKDILDKALNSKKLTSSESKFLISEFRSAEKKGVNLISPLLFIDKFLLLKIEF